jgi:hypothetical protein
MRLYECYVVSRDDNMEVCLCMCVSVYMYVHHLHVHFCIYGNLDERYHEAVWMLCCVAK